MFSFDRSLSDWPSLSKRIIFLSLIKKGNREKINESNSFENFWIENSKSTFEFGYGKGGLEISAIISFLIS